MKFTNNKSYAVIVDGQVVEPGKSIGDDPKPITKKPASKASTKSEEDES